MIEPARARRREDRGRHRYDGLSPGGAVSQHDIKRVSSTSRRRRATAGDRMRGRLRRVLRAPARQRRGCDDPAAIGGDFCAVYEPPLAEGRDIVSIHLSAGISGTCESRRRRGAAMEGRAASGIQVYDIAARLWRPGYGGPCRGRVPGAGEDGAGARGGRTRRDELEMVRDRHARVPPQGRPDRGRAGMAGLGAPDRRLWTLGEESRPSSGCARAPRIRADGRLRAPARRRGWLGRPAQDPGPHRPVEQCREVPTPSPSSSRRSGR